jgi:hypothetical protein
LSPIDREHDRPDMQHAQHHDAVVAAIDPVRQQVERIAALAAFGLEVAERRGRVGLCTSMPSVSRKSASRPGPEPISSTRPPGATAAASCRSASAPDGDGALPTEAA